MVKLQVFETPTAIKHAPGAVENLADEVRCLGGRKPLLVTDQGVIKAGLLDKIVGTLEKEKILYGLFNKVVGNPPVELVAEGTKIYQDNECDMLIAVGGGSSMDTAKAIGVEVVHGGSILEYEYGKKEITKRIPPLIAIPTTSGTGSEVTLWAVITDRKRKYKFNVGGTPLIGAHVALVDPLLTLSLPASLTAYTGMDALSHAIECYTCAYAQPVTDAVALLAIEYIARYLRIAFAYSQDVEARYKMAMAALMAGLSYGTESAGAVHAMAQTFGGYYDVHHGYLTAVMLAPVMEYNMMGNPEKFARIAQAMGEDTVGLKLLDAARLGVQAVAHLARDLEIPPLRTTGVKEEDIPTLAKAAEEDPQTIGNPRDIDARGYEKLYRRLLAD